MDAVVETPLQECVTVKSLHDKEFPTFNAAFDALKSAAFADGFQSLKNKSHKKFSQPCKLDSMAAYDALVKWTQRVSDKWIIHFYSADQFLRGSVVRRPLYSYIVPKSTDESYWSSSVGQIFANHLKNDTVYYLTVEDYETANRLATSETYRIKDSATRVYRLAYYELSAPRLLGDDFSMVSRTYTLEYSTSSNATEYRLDLFEPTEPFIPTMTIYSPVPTFVFPFDDPVSYRGEVYAYRNRGTANELRIKAYDTAYIMVQRAESSISAEFTAVSWELSRTQFVS